jgi:hypothetical protein
VKAGTVALHTRIVVLAVLAVATVAALGWALARARAERADAYGALRAEQRRAVAAPRAPVPAPAAEASRPQCVTGLDTFAVALERTLLPLPEGRARRVAALRALSDAAVRAERSAELARPAPTLPRRMGLEHGEPVRPEKRACDGAGYAELR